MRTFLAALQFLTIVPVPSRAVSPHHLEHAAWFFPLVGLLIGASAAALDFGLAHLLPAPPLSVLTVMALLGISGCFHLDGLADTADGFLSSRPRERILEIMKDSRSGPMAIAAVVCVLALKMTALAALPPERWWPRGAAILLMALAGRCALVWEMAVLRYARPEGGLAAIFAKQRMLWPAAWALVILAAAGWLTLGRAGLLAAGAAVLVTLLFCLYCHRKIGGYTGDTLGAACEIAEVVPALMLVALRLAPLAETLLFAAQPV